MENHDEAELAWRAWHLLMELERLLWDRYRPEFIRFVEQHANQNDPNQPHSDTLPPE